VQANLPGALYLVVAVVVVGVLVGALVQRYQRIQA
jgi:hypothetical protein